MAHHTPAHPLDADIVDLVANNLGAAQTKQVEAHLQDCLLCRIKRQRIRSAPPINLSDISDLVAPSFPRIDSEAISDPDPQSGQLWLTTDEDPVMVLVRVVRNGGLVAVPVTLDIEAADSETLVLDESASPLEVPLAIYERLTFTIPASALARRILPARDDVDLLFVSDEDRGVSRGSKIEDRTDVRLELRQYLADRLSALSSIQGETAEDAEVADDISGDQLFLALQDQVRMHRGEEAVVEGFTLESIASELPSRWRGVALVEEFAVKVLVIDTPHGLSDDNDFVAAQRVFTRFNASAIAVSTLALSGRSELYDFSNLVGSGSVESGEPARRPMIDVMDTSDVVAKYLDHKISIPGLGAESASRGNNVDVPKVIERTVAEAVRRTVETGSRARTPEKKNGLTAVGDSAEGLASAIRSALTGEFDVEAVLLLALENEA